MNMNNEMKEEEYYEEDSSLDLQGDNQIPQQNSE